MRRPTDRDLAVRLATFHWLEEQVHIHGDVLPHGLLQKGFEYEGRRVPMLGPKGIFKPAVLDELPLTITTAPDGPYDDSLSADGLLKYRYRGLDPRHPDNAGLRNAMQLQVPLVYLLGIAKGRYLAVWPVFIVGDDPAGLTFTVAADDARLAASSVRQIGNPISEIHEVEGRRAYITSTVRTRLHQRSFRERVLQAYREQCALCRLRHRELLDAAHIIPDKEPTGEPLVANGLALCKLHHAAFDHNLLGIRPDYTVEVHPKVLKESDGPMLRHGLQGLHNSSLVLPTARRNRPDPKRLAARYERFRSVA